MSEPSRELAQQHDVQAVMMSMKPSRTILEKLAQLLDAGVLRTEVTKVYSLREAHKAWNDILSHHVHGKIVLDVPY